MGERVLRYDEAPGPHGGFIPEINVNPGLQQQVVREMGSAAVGDAENGENGDEGDSTSDEQ